MNYSRTQTKWIKFGKIHDFVFIGKDVLAMASGLHVHFLDTTLQEKRIEVFNDQERGCGVSNLAGHPTVPMFCVVDKACNPNVRVFTYPGIKKISSCSSKEESNGFLSCTFAGTDYVLGLTTFPDFNLIVWSWRTGDQIFTKSTKMEELVQTIVCSPFSPHVIAQFAPSNGKLAIYQMCVCSKIVTLYQIEIKMFERKLMSVCWTIDGNILLCDEFSDIWLMSADGSSSSIIIKGNTNFGTFDRRPFAVAFQNGVLRVNVQNEVSFYRKLFTHDGNHSKDNWRKIWSLEETKRFIRAKAHNQRDGVLLHDECGQISEISMLRNDVPRFEIIYTDGIEYKELIPIPSRSTHFVVIDKFDRLNVIDANTGQVTSKIVLKLHGGVACANAHPTLAVISTSSVTGNCLLVDVSTNVAKMITCFHLHKISLDKMNFSNEGNILGIGNSRSGLVFLIGPNFNEGNSTIIRFLPTKIKIANFLIYDQRDDVIKILILPMTNFDSMTGNKLILISLNMKLYEEKVECVIDLPYFFKSLHYGLRKDTDVVGVPYLSKQLQRMEIRNDFEDFLLAEALPSIHQLKNIEVYVDYNRLITSGYDGHVVIRDSNDLRKIIAIFMSHHRRDGGVKSVLAVGETIVSLGRNGDLIANKLWHRHAISEPNEGENRILRSPNPSQQFYNFNFNLDQLYNEGQDTYFENMDKSRLKKEKDEALPVQRTILLEVEELRVKIKDLLDSNERESMEARLPISAYDLDIEYRKEKIEKARLEREELKQRFEKENERRNNVYKYLRHTFWDPERVHGCLLRSIYGEIVVKNYPLSIVDVQIDDFHISEGFTIHILNIYGLEKYPNENNENGKKSASESEATKIDLNDDDNSVNRFYESVNFEEKLRLSGTTLHKWIKDEVINLIHQLKGRQQSTRSNEIDKDGITRHREYSLMNYFNERFDHVRSLKGQEMENARKNVERLKFCAKEIDNMFEDKCKYESVKIQVWHHSEIPDYVITVEDNEISAIPCVDSKDESSVCEKENSIDRDEKIDTIDREFYEIALDKMMDGVLDRRWEDEIKRDIPKPDCLIKYKSRSKFTSEEIEALKSYESKMEWLRSERQRYRSMLEIEMEEIKAKTSKSFSSFDEKLKTFQATRAAIESSILQEKLMRLREILRNRHICEENASIDRLKEEDIPSIAKKIRRLAQDSLIYEMIVNELKNRYEGLLKREKILEGRFRGEFIGNLKQPMIEHLLRHYKRRPRIGNLACTSVTYLTELGKCVIGNEKSDILPLECVNFLRGLQSLDTMPDNLPSLIDDVHWRTMCKLRRTKIEIELKVRCCAVELAEAEETWSFCQKTKQTMHNEMAQLKTELEERERNFVEYVKYPEIQLVMKMGQVEVPLRGRGLEDFQGTVLISRRELISTNEEIEKAGKRKLTAMRESIDLRKKISHREWRHRCLLLTLKHLRDELKSLRKVKITKDLQKYLTELPIVKDPRKEYDELERTTREMKKRYEKLLSAEGDRLENLRQEIDCWRTRNVESTRKIEEAKVKNRELASRVEDPMRKRDLEFRRRRLAGIMKRTELVKEIQTNYDELLTLHSRLESLRLRTYPTLRFNKSVLS